MENGVLEAIDYLIQNRGRFEAAAELQTALWNGVKPARQPILLKCSLDEEDDKKLPAFNTKETHYDSEMMFMQGLREMLAAAYGGAEAVPSMRANMGCGIFPTLFGVKQQLFDDKMPWVREHLDKAALLKMGPEDLKLSDEFKAGLDHMAFMAERIAGTGCLIFPMDLQGAFDTAHIVYGDTIFYDLFDDPGFVHHLLELSCEAIFMGMEACFKYIPGAEVKIAHYNGLVIPRAKGGIKISEDTSTLLSKAHIEEFVEPYMNKILTHFGGGYVHYCGKNRFLFEAVMRSRAAFGINFGNPEMHDMDYVLRRCAELSKIYFGDVPQNDDESLEDFFFKCLTASRKGEISLLLLQKTCSRSERNMVLEAWEKANISCM